MAPRGVGALCPRSRGRHPSPPIAAAAAARGMHLDRAAAAADGRPQEPAANAVHPAAVKAGERAPAGRARWPRPSRGEGRRQHGKTPDRSQFWIQRHQCVFSDSIGVPFSACPRSVPVTKFDIQGPCLPLRVLPNAQICNYNPGSVEGRGEKGPVQCACRSSDSGRFAPGPAAAPRSVDVAAGRVPDGAADVGGRQAVHVQDRVQRGKVPGGGGRLRARARRLPAHSPLPHPVSPSSGAAGPRPPSALAPPLRRRRRPALCTPLRASPAQTRARPPT